MFIDLQKFSNDMIIIVEHTLLEFSTKYCEFEMGFLYYVFAAS